MKHPKPILFHTKNLVYSRALALGSDGQYGF